MSELATPAITYKFTNLNHDGSGYKLIAELPLNESSFSLCLNEAGPWAGTLNVEDPQIRKSEWLEATNVGRTAMWVDIDGILYYGGRVLTRNYQMSTGLVQLGGTDAYGYLSQRYQAFDYTEYVDPESHAWALAPGAPSTRIAYYMIKQTLEKEYSLPIKLVEATKNPLEADWITISVPLQQHQPLASILTQIHEMGYGVGCDVYASVAYQSGAPEFFITIAYPRAGESPLGGPNVIELSQALDMQYSEEGADMANKVVEQAGGSGAEFQEWGEPEARKERYPLLEKLVSHPSLSPSELTSSVLESYGKADVALYAYPLTVPKITLPMFGTPSLADLSKIGDDTELWIPQTVEPNNNPRFPEGLRFLFRTARIDCQIPNEGVPTMEVTLNIPPSSTVITPPLS